MKLYFRPFACSFSSRITLYEAGLAAELVEVDRQTGRGADGIDFLSIHPLGMVPALVLDDGRVLTENAAILQYLASRAPDSRLAPAEEPARSYLRQWLSFIGTELHEAFVPLLDKTTPADVNAWALRRLEPRLAHVARHLAERTYLLDDYSVADPYLLAILNWAQVTPIKLETWPALTAFMARMLQRPAVARAFGEERELYVAALGRAKA